MVQCYYKNDDNPNLIRSINSGVCMGSGSASGVFQCCFPWDDCLPDGLCYAYSKSTYYTALCTDQTLEDPVCQHGCNGLYRTDVTYNSTVNLWACCDGSDPTCSTSYNTTFEAPAPAQLLQQTMTIVDFIPTSTATSSSTIAATSTSSISSTISTTAPAQVSQTATIPRQQISSSSLSKGAIAGIGIGAALLAILLIVGGLIILKRHRRNSHNMQPHSSTTGASKFFSYSSYQGDLPAYDNKHEKDGVYVCEAPTTNEPHSHRAEVPGHPIEYRPTGAHADRGGIHELT